MRRVHKLLPLLLPLLALALLAVAFLATMAHSDERPAGTNSVNDEALVVRVGGGSRVCQRTLVPGDAAIVRLPVAPIARGGPPMSMTVVAASRTVASARIPAGWKGDTLSFAFSRVAPTAPRARICIRNEGRAAVRFGGTSLRVPTSTLLNGRPEKAVLTISWFRPGKSDWWSLLPAIAHRAGILKGSLAGAWSFWAGAALLLLTGALAIGMALRGVRE